MRKAAAALAAWLRRPQPLFWLAVAACTGIYIADAWPRPHPALLPSLLGAALLIAGLLRRCRSAALAAACGIAFAWLHGWYDADPLRSALEAARGPGGAVPARVTGVIADAPEPGFVAGSYSFPLRLVALESILLPGAYEGATVYVHLNGAAAAPRYGDRISLTGLLRRPPGPRNPGEFDFAAFLRRQSMAAEFEATAAYGGLEVLAMDQGNAIVALALRARDWIGNAVTAGITDQPEIAATVRTMVLGTREKTPSEVEDAFKDSGTMHVFAVSGLHVAMFCVVVFTLLRVLGLRYGWILCIALPLVYFYVFITGLRPSAWRAAIMGTVFLCAPLFDRESRTLNSLGASALLLLAWDTQQLFQPGFTLSFGVILAIGLLYPAVRRWTRRIGEPDEFLPRQLLKEKQFRALRAGLWTQRFVRDSVTLSLVSTIGSAGLMIHYFHLITPIGIVANLVIVLLSNVILVGACVSLLAAGAGLTFLSVLCNQGNGLLAQGTVASARFFASVPGGHMHFDFARMWRGDVCEITVLGLDHGGACIHIDTPAGRHWLIDAGGLRHFSRTVRPHLIHSPVNALDGLIVSHTDAYHTGGAAGVRQQFPPAREPQLRAGDSLTLDEGIVLTCLFPQDNHTAGMADDRCGVYRLDVRGTRILLTGDAGFLTEKALLASEADVRADILIKSRHGRDFSGLPEFINAVRPAAAIFSNDIFPDNESVPPEWIDRVARKGAQPFDQRRTGAVVIRRDRDGVLISGFSNAQKQWLPPPH